MHNKHSFNGGNHPKLTTFSSVAVADKKSANYKVFFNQLMRLSKKCVSESEGLF